VTNTLAYCRAKSITALKGFIVQALGCLRALPRLTSYATEVPEGLVYSVVPIGLGAYLQTCQVLNFFQNTTFLIKHS
jgi:hypothetical protein